MRVKDSDELQCVGNEVGQLQMSSRLTISKVLRYKKLRNFRENFNHGAEGGLDQMRKRKRQKIFIALRAGFGYVFVELKRFLVAKRMILQTLIL